MTEIRIGYARCSTNKQDLIVQQEALVSLGVTPDRIYTDKGLTGSNRLRPELDQALAAVRQGDTLVVPKLNRLHESGEYLISDLVNYFQFRGRLFTGRFPMGNNEKLDLMKISKERLCTTAMKLSAICRLIKFLR